MACGQGESITIAWHVGNYCQLLEDVHGMWDCRVDRVNHYCQLLEDCMACGQGESLLSTVGRLHGMWAG